MPVRKVRILIVDDNPTDLLITRAVVNKMKVLELQTAENGIIAEGKLVTAADMRQPYDLVIMDWNMPRGNGLKLLQFIRAEPRLKHTKIIIMTGTANAETVDDAIENGANDFVVKPVEGTRLEAKINKLLVQ